MTAAGLEYNYYLVNNPIYLYVEGAPLGGGLAENYPLTIVIGERVITAQMHNGMAIIDIAPIVKTLMNVPYFNTPNTNIVSAGISISYVDDMDQPQIINIGTKTFVRGGLYTGNNNYLSNNTVLKESELIPVWDNYPAKKYVISGTQILAQDIPVAESEIMREHACEGAYLKFRNSKGGYSHYLFNTYTVGNSLRSMETLDQAVNSSILLNIPLSNFYQLGENSNKELTVEARFGKRHFDLLNSLVESDEVWIYQIHKILGSDIVVNDWTKLINPGNSISIESGDEAIDVSLKFELRLTKDNRLNG